MRIKLEEILSDPEKAFQFGLSSPKEHWKQHGDKIIATIALDPYWSYKARTDWSDGRFDAQLVEACEKIQEMYRAVPKEKERTYRYFVHKTDPITMAEISLADFYKAERVFAYISGGPQEAAFFKNFREAAEQGTVGPWAQTILDHIKENSIGANNYRQIFTRDVA